MAVRDDGLAGARDLAALRARVPVPPLSRFAPAATGHLHLGHVVNAIHVWGLARSLGGRVLLRIEDHDRQRCRPEYEASILDDLDWLGLAPDVHPTAAFRAGRCDGRQSDRDAVYRQGIAALASRGLVYGCRCTRREIGASGQGVGDELRYPGTCRSLGLPLDDGLGWRLRLEPGVEVFDDVRHGPSAQDPAAQCGDLLLRDRLGNWTYQYAVVVDDTAQGIDLVVRGDDLFASTGRQIRLARLLGRTTPPVFAHHPLVMKSPTQKLSKSDGDSGVRDLRAAGWSAGRVLGAAAHAAGLLPTLKALRTDDLAEVVATRR
ncbi:MAG: glutamate--tRNA ligase family protein [Vicinamibacterales bacterium]